MVDPLEEAKERTEEARELNDNFLSHACCCKVFVKTRVVLQGVEGDGNKRFCHCKDLAVSDERIGQDSKKKKKTKPTNFILPSLSKHG